MSYLELEASPAAVASARKHAKAVALEFGLSLLADIIELIVSELTTNAVRASEYLCHDSLTTPVVRLWLASDSQCMLIRVWDASDLMPVRQDAGPDDESGRGLMLVNSLCSKWGAYRKRIGKVVWVMVG
jgi:anti-sigma regulatory factor (Ser/Thr protein kinase)